ncbi:MAG: molybdate ABC transporter substrate-binding protein, partial [Steroidobacteraceae bacterium]
MLLAPVTALAGEALLAVATNFGEAAERLAADFAARGAHRITLATGSTGKLYAQIRNGAPFDALLAADAERPALLEASGHGVPGTRFVYAAGLLTLWSPDARRIGGDGRAVLARGEFAALAIANP